MFAISSYISFCLLLAILIRAMSGPMCPTVIFLKPPYVTLEIFLWIQITKCELEHSQLKIILLGVINGILIFGAVSIRILLYYYFFVCLFIFCCLLVLFSVSVSLECIVSMRCGIELYLLL